jgi:hypothetical protein
VIIRSRLHSEHLGENLLGDPSERDLFVYVPPGFPESGIRYPVAFLLHAFGQTAAELVDPPTDKQRWVPPIEDVLDPVFRRMDTPPMIVVIPDGTMRYGCGQWVDSPVSGNFEQFVVNDVVAYVDDQFPTIADPISRGILGFSSGGVGAWNIASAHPETFGAMAMLSGDSLLDITHKPVLYEYLNSIWPDAPNGPLEGNFLSDLVYAYSACYSPNADNPPFFVDLPIEFPSGELVAQAWERWLQFDPVVNWRDRLDNLRKLSGILLDVGVADDYHLQWGHRLLSHYLTEAGIPHLATENEGNHGGRSRERIQLALQWLSGVLVRG